MSRSWAVIRREFTEMVQSRAFLIGTVLGPLLVVGMVVLQVATAERGGGGGERALAVVDAYGAGVGNEVARALSAPAAEEGEARTRFGIVEVSVPAAGESELLRTRLLARVEAGAIDGFLWLPAGLTAGDTARYEGKNATNRLEMARIRAAVQAAIQGARLGAAGIEPTAVDAALAPVPFRAQKIGSGAVSGSSSALVGLTTVVGFATYIAVLLIGAAVMRGVLEEKRDRIVEVVISSIQPEQLLVGKVLGIGAAGMLQMLIWGAFGVLAATQGGAVAAHMGAPLPEFPTIPLMVALLPVFYFGAGFFLYATLYAAVGAISTTEQEAGQLQLPVLMCLIGAASVIGPVVNDPEGTLARVGSIFPLTAPVLMPVRAVVTAVPPLELAASMILVVLATLLLLRVSARIYRIGILATGKRPTLRELWRWARTA